MESKKNVVAAWCTCGRIVVAMTGDAYNNGGKQEIDECFDNGLLVGRTTKTEARELFGCECASQEATTSKEALPIADVGETLPSDTEVMAGIKKQSDKRKEQGYPMTFRKQQMFELGFEDCISWLRGL